MRSELLFVFVSASATFIQREGREDGWGREAGGEVDGEWEGGTSRWTTGCGGVYALRHLSDEVADAAAPTTTGRSLGEIEFTFVGVVQSGPTRAGGLVRLVSWPLG